MLADCLSINEKGHLTIGGADTIQLAGTFGTPLYILSEQEIQANCHSFTGAMNKYYGDDALVTYAGKALCCKEMCRIVHREGLCLDVASAGELHTALSAGFPAAKIFMHGNNKPEHELRYALESGVGTIVVDNFQELFMLERLAGEMGCRQRILLRIKPCVEAHTHSYVVTGAIDSKFGFALENGDALKAAVAAIASESLEYRGLHCHIGSQIFDTAPFCETVNVMVKLIHEIEKGTGRTTAMLNLGGGFGVRYTDKDRLVTPNEYLSAISSAFFEACKTNRVQPPQVVIEPGRSIIASAGITLYTVGSIKCIENIRTYVSVDGGLPDNPRYALYSSPYTILSAERAGGEATMKVTIAGRCCESGDLLQEHIDIQPVEPGDILAVLIIEERKLDLKALWKYHANLE